MEEIIEATNADETLQAIKAHIEAGHSYLANKESKYNKYRQTLPTSQSLKTVSCSTTT